METVLDNALAMIDTDGKSMYDHQSSDGVDNKQEARMVFNAYRKIQSLGLEKSKIGIIAPYWAQVNAIKCLVDDDDVKVSTVDGFQGGEKEVIIVSLTRSNRKKKIGFLNDKRRMNVAITRGKRLTLLIGDSGTYSSVKEYKQLITYLKEQGTLLKKSF